MNANLLRRFITFFTIMCIATLASCSSREEVSPATQTPSFHNSEIPEGQFLFVFVEDDDYTCLDGLCGCPVSEAPPMPFEFRDDKLLLYPYWFDPTEPNSVTLEEIAAANVLYGDYSQWTANLRLSSTFPIETLASKLLIVGANSQGDIQIQADAEYMVVPVGSKYNAEEPETQSENCKVLHKYTLTNYGFIKDTNVELYKYE